MASVLIAYGGVLAGLGFLLQQVAPVIGKVTYITGFVGGGLCLLLGIAALAGLKGRVWAALTTIAVTLVLLSQTVPAWMASAGEGSASLTLRLVVTAMMFLTMGMLMYLMHGERPPEFYQSGTTRRGDPFSSRNETESRDTQSKR